MPSENASTILDKALAGDAAAVFDLVRLELSGRARDTVNKQGEQPLQSKTPVKEKEAD